MVAVRTNFKASSAHPRHCALPAFPLTIGHLHNCVKYKKGGLVDSQTYALSTF